MNVFTMPNGDIELGDWPARMNPEWINIAWILTHRCTMDCPYCIGWKGAEKTHPTLIDKLGVAGVVAQFEQLRKVTGKKFYITMSGGEPTHEPKLAELCKSLTELDFVVELHSNITNSSFKNWADSVVPRNIGQVMATYHGWKLDKVEAARKLYLENFHYAYDKGLTPVLKRVVLPTEVATIEQELERLRKIIPSDSPILLWGYIANGQPKSNTDFGNAYPYAYTNEQKEILNKVRKYRSTCQKMYHDGAGFFKGMSCDAGRGFVYMDIDGRISRCYPYKHTITVGDFTKGTLTLNECPKPCAMSYCGTPYWGVWFGTNPWDYTVGWSKENTNFNRFGSYTGEIPTYGSIS